MPASVYITEEPMEVTVTGGDQLTVTGGLGTPSEDPPVKVQLDDAGGGVTYVGEAVPGSSVAGAFWRIKRITETGDDIAVEWADGTNAFAKIWNNRTGYAYS